MTTNPDWVCGTCDGTNLFYVYEAPENGGKFIREEPCGSAHVGPFVVDGEELWADPEKVVWWCNKAKAPTRRDDRTIACDYGVAYGHIGCGYRSVGVRLEQVKETE